MSARSASRTTHLLGGVISRRWKRSDAPMVLPEHLHLRRLLADGEAIQEECELSGCPACQHTRSAEPSRLADAVGKLQTPIHVKQAHQRQCRQR